jgi:hypothetical protein
MTNPRLVVLAAVLALAACKGKKQDTLSNKAGDSSIAKVDPTLCDINGRNVVTSDINKDNRADVWRVFKTEDEGGTKIEFLTCKQVDFDHDGKIDWVVAYTRKGTPLYEKADFTWDGKFDMSAVYDPKSGKIAEVERDIDFDGKFDVKEVYDTGGVLTSVRRDRNADGNPDLWEQYKDGELLAILYDDNFDTKVDRKEEVPGSRPKVEMPTQGDGTASGSINDPATGSGSGTPPPPAQTPPAPKQ